ncbi:MAG TPA: 3'(2'),5'-bisphosphate nucleotidase CysQ [Terriglobia bacterium]|nr:3'(2'),5'-bisphosphate nucleotidase CysQ [Terriglobia bacterium]
MTSNTAQDTVSRIAEALDAARQAIARFVPGAVEATEKPGGRGPLTEADQIGNRVLREMLPRAGEGWLSEESVDDLARLKARRVWVVDPLDGTNEFIAGVPEWCISVAMVEDGLATAGGIVNPVTGEVIVGSRETGVTANGKTVRVTMRQGLLGAVILASRSEVARGEWDRFRDAPFSIRPTGSVAYKLARVAAGLADATWTLTCKNEWDVAAGAALVEAAGGFVLGVDGSPLRFNQASTLLPGLMAGGMGLRDELMAFLRPHRSG